MKIAGLVRAGFLSVGMSGMALGCVATLDAADPPDVGDDPRGLPARAHFQVGTCGVDEMRERVCGSLAEPVDVAADGPFWDCPADPRRLTAAGPAMMFYADTKEMEFDRRMTLRYRRERAAACSVVDRRGAADDEEQASAEERLKGECCFSRCTPLPAGDESERGIPSGYREKSMCVDAPEGGTRHPAKGFAECPNALVFGVGPLPYDADPFDAEATRKTRAGQKNSTYFADVPRCCYRVLDVEE
ncbi:MAG: hypothetical protein R3B70_12290 [Polyangiaceae bacterium]